MKERRIFGIKSLVRLTVICLLVILIPYIVTAFFDIRHRFFWFSITFYSISVLRSKFIIVENKRVKFYTLFGLIRKQPKWLFLTDIQKMNIKSMAEITGWNIHLLLSNDMITTITMPLSRGEIKTFEQLMMSKGIEVQNPDK